METEALAGERPGGRRKVEAVAALRRGGKTAIFLLRIILPLSFAVSLLDWLGVLRWIGLGLAPAMRLWGLPGESAVVLVSGWLVGIYGAAAAIAILPLTGNQITVLAVWALTCHNLLVECTVQDRAGTSWRVMLATRMVGGALLAYLTSLALSRIGGDGAAAAAATTATATAVSAVRLSLEGFLLHWLSSALRLSAKVFVILLGLMLVTEWMRARDVFHKLAQPLRPVLRMLGLSGSVAFLWITAIVLGVAYGSGLLMEEAKEPGRYKPRDLRDLNVSIGLFHSILEDTAVLAACGAGLFWITIPRLVFAAVGVRIARRILPRRT